MRTIQRIAPALAGAAAALALALTGCSGGAPSDAADQPTESKDLGTLTVAVTGIAGDGALYKGIEQGFFEEEGLTIETTLVANPAAGLAAAQSGQVDVINSPTIPFLNTVSQGIPLVAVAPAGGYPDEIPEGVEPEDFDETGLFVSPASGITSIEELEGKTIAVLARKGGFEVTIATALDQAGVDPQSINWVALDFASSVAALENGTVDAAGLITPFTYQAEAAGATKIAAPSIAFHEYGAAAYWCAGADTVEKKAEQLAAFQRAMIKSNAWANEHPKEALTAGLEAVDSPLSVEQLGITYWPTELRASDIDRVNQKMAALGFLPAPVDLDGLIFEN